MLIYCPKCSAGYEVDDDLIKNKDKMVRCSNCNNVFDAESLIEKTVDNLEDISEENAFEALAALMRDADTLDSSEIFADRIKDNVADNEEDAVKVVEDFVEDETSVAEEEKINEKTDDNENDSEKEENPEKEENKITIEDIYERLSLHTSNLIEREKNLPFHERFWFKIKEILGFHFKVKWGYVVLGILIFVSLSLFNNRYDVVRMLPFMNSVYNAFGVKAKIVGEGLEFQNVTWDYFMEDNIGKMEIKGFINNTTSDSIEIPFVHVEILDKATSLLQSFNQKLKDDSISPNGKVPLQLIVENPAPTAKYVYFTFIDEQ